MGISGSISQSGQIARTWRRCPCMARSTSHRNGQDHKMDRRTARPNGWIPAPLLPSQARRRVSGVRVGNESGVWGTYRLNTEAHRTQSTGGISA